MNCNKKVCIKRPTVYFSTFCNVNNAESEDASGVQDSEDIHQVTISVNPPAASSIQATSDEGTEGIQIAAQNKPKSHTKFAGVMPLYFFY